jgi:anti-sigma regulatory factor (Ser/Thr protein kinase)
MAGRGCIVRLPNNLSTDRTGDFESFLQRSVGWPNDSRPSTVTLDFSSLGFIEPDGIVALGAIIDALKTLGVVVRGRGVDHKSGAVDYLRGCGFFQAYSLSMPDDVFLSRPSMFEYRRLAHRDSFLWIRNELMPWMASALGRPKAAMAEVEMCVQEIFNNIDDHSTKDIGCVAGQSYQNGRSIDLAVSDYGVGIPHALRSQYPSLSDAELIVRSTDEGVTSKTSRRNRGAGLSLLKDNVIGRFGGQLTIVSGKGKAAFRRQESGGQQVGVSELATPYPGTLIRIRLLRDSLPTAAPESEELDW